jgi:hypothetical protein
MRCSDIQERKRNNVEDYRGVTILSAKTFWIAGLKRNLQRLEESNVCHSTWLHEEPIDVNEPIGVCIFREQTSHSACWIQLRASIIPSIRIFQRLLLNEMSVGIEPARCMWLGSYLSGRIQKIRIGDAVSKDIKVTSDVPQGSHLVCQQNIGDFQLRPCTLLFFFFSPSLLNKKKTYRDPNGCQFNVSEI